MGIPSERFRFVWKFISRVFESAFYVSKWTFWELSSFWGFSRFFRHFRTYRKVFGTFDRKLFVLLSNIFQQGCQKSNLTVRKTFRGKNWFVKCILSSSFSDVERKQWLFSYKSYCSVVKIAQLVPGEDYWGTTFSLKISIVLLHSQFEQKFWDFWTTFV